MKATTDVVPAIYKQGERFCQLVIVSVPDYTITEVADLSETDRGAGGFGSTGTGTDKEVSAATGADGKASEQPQPANQPAAALSSAEVEKGQA